MKKGYNLLILKALSFFVENPYEKIHLREFSRKLKISINSTQRFLNLFLKERLILEERVSNLRYFKANIDSLIFRSIKIVFSIKEIENSGILDEFKNKCGNFIIFGSVAEGRNDKNSDLDILIIGKNKSELRLEFLKFKDKFSKEINLHILPLEEWRNQAKINKAFYQEIISKGLCLIGEKPIVN